MPSSGSKRHAPTHAVRVRVRKRRVTHQNPHRGPSVERFLREEGLYEDASVLAIKEVLIFQIDEVMKRQGLTKAELARRMRTSRSAVDRLLDPTSESVTLSTLFRAAAALDSDLRIELRSRSSETPRRRTGT